MIYQRKRKCYVKFKQNNQIASTLKINQSVNVEWKNVIEITKACTVAFIKARNYLFVP